MCVCVCVCRKEFHEETDLLFRGEGKKKTKLPLCSAYKKMGTAVEFGRCVAAGLSGGPEGTPLDTQPQPKSLPGTGQQINNNNGKKKKKKARKAQEGFRVPAVLSSCPPTVELHLRSQTRCRHEKSVFSPDS